MTYEDPNEMEVVKRLKVIGATSDDLEHLHVVIATEELTRGIEWLARLVRSTGAAVVVIDSVGEANAVEGVDENSDNDWGQWARHTLRRLIDLAADPEWEHSHGTPANDWVAELPIDHSTKAKDNPYFPSGTKRKRAMVTGMMLMMQVRQSFGVGAVGRVQLITAKDRTGRFRRIPRTTRERPPWSTHTVWPSTSTPRDRRPTGRNVTRSSTCSRTRPASQTTRPTASPPSGCVAVPGS